MKEEGTITTGSDILDDLLKGGYETDIVTTIYGPSGSGKSNLAMLALVANSDKKVFYVDTESGFSVSRLKQLTSEYEKVLDNTMLVTPGSLEDQGTTFEKLKNAVSKNVGLLVVDSIAMLYRLEVAKKRNVKEINQQLAEQIANLIRIARDQNVPVVVTNQVYSSFENPDEVKLVGGDILKYGSKCLIELRKDNGTRTAVVQKHRSMPAGEKRTFRIVNEGLENVE